MTYTPQTWVDGSAGGTPVTAARLDYMEKGIEAVSALEIASLLVLATISTTSTGYITNANGPSVQFVVPPSLRVLVTVGAQLSNGTAGGYALMSFDVFQTSNGASQYAASDATALFTSGPDIGASRSTLVTFAAGQEGLKHTARARYRVGSGSGNFTARNIIVVPSP